MKTRTYSRIFKRLVENAQLNKDMPWPVKLVSMKEMLKKYPPIINKLPERGEGDEKEKN